MGSHRGDACDYVIGRYCFYSGWKTGRAFEFLWQWDKERISAVNLCPRVCGATTTTTAGRLEKEESHDLGFYGIW